LRLGETTYQALVALAEYDPNQPFEDQIWPMAKAADPLFTCLQELGTMLPQRYGYTASREEGAKGFFANIFAAINLRVQVNGAGAAGAKMGVEITLPGKVLVVPEDRSDLRVFLTNHFDLEELRTFCFDIGVDMDSLPGEGKAGKCRELVTHFERRAYGIPGLQRLVMKRLGIQ